MLLWLAVALAGSLLDLLVSKQYPHILLTCGGGFAFVSAVTL